MGLVLVLTVLKFGLVAHIYRFQVLFVGPSLVHDVHQGVPVLNLVLIVPVSVLKLRALSLHVLSDLLVLQYARL